ncbi:Protein CBR-DUO-2 [Caenorhabditis briggsae]|uniref:Protein CBR-DUO-2 n=1 Tax=Caenorhabditis briggsae TaxID=6238 RepID=A8WS96_CAEBR|nr:Protein CBR-DUO-2 [Caenorhabditis briggsae]CAP23354.2 Protein CBR-DUO-2 [Caenorhabditis briggsae]
MTEEFLVEVNFVKKGGKLISFKNRRLSFGNDSLVILAANDDPLKFHCSKIQHRKLKTGSNSKNLSIGLVEGNDTDYVSLKLEFSPPHDQFMDWVINEFNKMITSNKDKMVSNTAKRKQAPMLCTTNNILQPVSRIKPLFNEETIKKERDYILKRSITPQLPRKENLHEGSNPMDELFANSDPIIHTPKIEQLEEVKDQPFDLYYSRCVHLKRTTSFEGKLFKTKETEMSTKYEFFQLFIGLISYLSLTDDDDDVFSKNLPTRISRKKLEEFRKMIGKINTILDNSLQQDAHECLGTVLEIMNDLFQSNRTLVGPPPSNINVSRLNPAEVFKLTIESMLVCQQCNTVVLKKDFQNDMKLDVSDNSSVQDLVNSWGKWTSVERRCSHCQANVSSTSERIFEFPSSLIITLKRYNYERNAVKKKHCSVEASFNINVSSLGVFRDVDHIHLEKLDIDESSIFPSKPFSPSEKVIPDDSQEEQTLKTTLPESTSEKDSQNDIVIEQVTTPKELVFDLLTEWKTVKGILKRLDIDHAEEKLRCHLETLKHESGKQMTRTDLPGKTAFISADGNCFYRAISWCLTGSQRYHRKLRIATSEYLKKNEESMRKFCGGELDYKKYVENVRKDGEWATSCEIYAVANLLDVEIVTFLGSSGWRSHVPHDGGSSKECIFLSNTSCHFEPTTSLKPFIAEKEKDEKSEIYQSSRSDSQCNQKRCRGESYSKDTTLAYKKLKIDNTPEPTGPNYSLMAVVCHFGESPYDGHYVAYTKNSSNGEQWVYCSDTEVHEVNKDAVANAIRSSGYIFFYDRKN